jgi:hypothetical protein
MPWAEGNIRVDHPREPWRPSDETAFINCRITQLEGTDHTYSAQRRSDYSDAYTRAKVAFDKDAALDIVERCKNEDTIDRLADIICHNAQDPIYVFPHPAFEDEIVGNVPIAGRPMNALPFAYAHFLAEVTSRNRACPADARWCARYSP